MKKIFLLFCITLTLSLFSTTVSAGIKMKPKKMTTEVIDAIWEKTYFVTNLLASEDQTQKYGKNETSGSIHLFVGKTDDANIQMSTLTTPKIMGSAVTLQALVNHEVVAIPIKIAGQLYDNNPKLINGKIVVHIYNLEKEYFYLVMDPDGSSYSTEIK